MTGLRIGSLFSGYGGLELGVQSLLGGAVLWTCDVDRSARAVLSARFPLAAVHGDVAQVPFRHLPSVDVLTGGFPCQNLSVAGRRGGLDPDQSGYLFERPSNWQLMADAIAATRPKLVVIENVRGLLNGPVRAVGPGREAVGGAFGRVLGDLADLGFDARWCCVRASDAGAPHERLRVFVAAWPAADPERGELQRWRAHGVVAGEESEDRGEGLQRQRDRDTTRDRSANAARWGDSADAITRWERRLGRRAPDPFVLTGAKRNNSPAFVEWMMGLPERHVTGVAGLTRAAMLRLLGNGVVPQQCRLALGRMLTCCQSVAS